MAKKDLKSLVAQFYDPNTPLTVFDVETTGLFEQYIPVSGPPRKVTLTQSVVGPEGPRPPSLTSFVRPAPYLERGDPRLLEIGAVKYVRGREVGRFRTFVDPGIPIPTASTALTGITAKDVLGAPSEATAVSRFQEFAKGTVLAAHNAPFDVAAIQAAALRGGVSLTPAPTIDILDLSKKAWPDSPSHALGNLAKQLGLETPPHRALGDVLIEKEVMGRAAQTIFEQAKGQQLALPGFEQPFRQEAIDYAIAKSYPKVLGPVSQPPRGPFQLSLFDLTRSIPAEEGVFHFPNVEYGPPLPAQEAGELLGQSEMAGSVKVVQRAAGEATAVKMVAKSGVGDFARGAVPRLKKLATTRNLLVAGAALTTGYYLFSGHDDDYNTIEGMSELGLAAQQRKILTDFGSGYQGEEDKGSSKLSKFMAYYAVGLGTFAVGKYGYRLGKIIANKGRTTFFHGTSAMSAESIIKEGLLGRHAGSEGSITKAALFSANNNLSSKSFENLVYLERNKKLALSYAIQTEELAKGVPLGDIQRDMEFLLKKRKGLYKKGVVQFSIPAWKEEFQAAKRINPEVARFASAKDFVEHHMKNRSLMEQLGESDLQANLKFRIIRHLLKKSQVYEGDIATKYIVGSRDFEKATWDEFREYLGTSIGKKEIGLTSLGIIGGATAAIWGVNKFSGKDDAYNTIEGLRHGGEAAKLRKKMTDFGSGYDRVRALAKMAGKTFEEFIESAGFKKALSEAKVVKRLKAGEFGYTELLETTLQGAEGPETFRFIRKTVEEARGKAFLEKHLSSAAEQRARQIYQSPTMEDIKATEQFLRKRYSAIVDPAHEASMLRKVTELEAETIPSYYGSRANEILMEYMPGQQVSDVILGGAGENLTKAQLARVGEAVQRDIGLLSKHKLINEDLHLGNLIYNPETGHTAWIDMGQLLSARSSALSKQQMTTRWEEIQGIALEEMKRKEVVAVRAAEVPRPHIDPAERIRQAKQKRAKRLFEIAPTMPNPYAQTDMAAISRYQQSAQQIVGEHSIRGGRGHLSRSSDRSVAHAAALGKIKPGGSGR